jgi:phage-related protein (TIGR01555 family)
MGVDMKKAVRRVKALQIENQKLSNQIKTLQNQENGITLSNSLGQLVQSAFAQSNLTSFNPILQNNIYAPLTINWTMLTYMYKTHGIIQTAIDMPVLDALRGGINILSHQLDTDDIKEIQDCIEEDGILDTLGEATVWKRLYGGGALIINTDQDPSTPLDLKKLKKLELYPCNRWELVSMWKPGDKMTELNPWLYAAAKESEHVYFYGEKFHNSRILTMSGKAAPYIVRWQLQGWGMSEVERMVEDFNSYIRTKNVLYEILEEAKVDIYKIQGYKQSLMTQAGTAKINERIQLTNELKNFNNALVMDKEDDFDFKQPTFSGLAEIMKENRIGIASALRMPLSKLFGLSATGFNSGEDDIENYNAMVESEVRTPMKKTIKTLLNLICVMKFGTKYDLSFEFNPLRVMSTLDEETVKTSKANRILSLYDRALLDSKEVGEMMQKDKLVSVETCAAQGLLDEHPQKPAMGGDTTGDTGESKSTKKGGETTDGKDGNEGKG